MTFNHKCMSPFNLTSPWKTYYLEASQLLKCLFSNNLKLLHLMIRIIINLVIGNRPPTFGN